MGSSKTTTTQNQNTQQNYTNTNAIEDRYNNANWQNYGQLQDWAANYKPVAIPRPLDFNADQLNAQQQIRDLGSPDAAYNKQQAAAQGRLAELMNYKPLDVTAPAIDLTALGGLFTGGGQGGGGQAYLWDAAQGKAANINRGDIRDVGTQMTPEILQQYLGMMDPALQQNVIDASLKDIERSRAMAQMPNATAAAQAGAFGGSRQGVLEAETNRAYGDIGAKTAAGVRLAGYNTALNAAQTDLARKLQAELANQGVDVNIATNNAQLQQQMEMANMAGKNQAGQSNATNQTNVSIANGQTAAQSANAMALARAQALANANIQNAQLGLAAGQSNQNAGLQAANLGLSGANSLFGNAQQLYGNAQNNANALSAVGGQGYALDQARQQADYNNAVQQANLTPYITSVLQNYLQGMPYGSTQTGNSQGSMSGTSETVQRPSLMSQITQGMGAIGGLLGGGASMAGLLQGMGGGGGSIGNGGAPIPSSFDPLTGSFKYI